METHSKGRSGSPGKTQPQVGLASIKVLGKTGFEDGQKANDRKVSHTQVALGLLPSGDCLCLAIPTLKFFTLALA